MPLEQDVCHYYYGVDGEGSPSQWLPYLNGTPGGTVVANAATDDGDVSYIRSDGLYSEQWFSVEDTGGAPTADAIRHILVVAIVKSDGFYFGNCRLTLGIGADTIGGGDHRVFPEWTRITEVFDLTPGASPAQFTWADIDNIDIGITSLTSSPGEIRCSRMHIMVDTCAYTACPRCCCCCLCFSPIVRIPAAAFTVELGTDDLPCPELVFTLQFCGFYFLGGCWFQHGTTLGDCAPDYTPYAVSDPVYSTLYAANVELRIVGISLVGNVLSVGGDCASLQIIFSLWNLDTNADSGTITFGISNTVLTECEPYHQSSIDMDVFTLTTIHTVTVDSAASITLDCSGDNTGEIPIP